MSDLEVSKNASVSQEDLKNEIQRVFEPLQVSPSQKRELQQKITAVVSRTIASPTPPPDFIEAYERYYPGSTKLLLEHTMEEGRHRRKLEEQHLNAQVHLQSRTLELEGTMQQKDLNTQRLGIAFAFVLAASMVLIAGVLFYNGHDAGGSVTIGAIAAIIGLFIFKRRSSDSTDDIVDKHEKPKKKNRR